MYGTMYLQHALLYCPLLYLARAPSPEKEKVCPRGCSMGTLYTSQQRDARYIQHMTTSTLQKRQYFPSQTATNNVNTAQTAVYTTNNSDGV